MIYRNNAEKYVRHTLCSGRFRIDYNVIIKLKQTLFNGIKCSQWKV